MKNDYITNPPEIKKNLIKLSKKSKKDFNKLIPKNNDQIKTNNEQKKRIKKKSTEKNNYLNFNSSLTENPSLQNLMKKIDIKNNYKTNIDKEKEKDDIILTDRSFKDKFDRIKIKNENKTLNISKNVEEIIKRRINEKNIQKIKNKVRKININKQKQSKLKLSKSKTIPMKEFKKSCLNNDINNKKIKNEEKNINENNIINKKQRNKLELEKTELNSIEEEKINEKYFETRRLSIDWVKDENENKDWDKSADTIITKEINNINNIDNKQLSSNSKINISCDEKFIKNRISVGKLSFNQEKSLKNDNYDYDSFYEDDNKTQKNISSNKTSENKNKNSKNKRNSNKSSIGKINPLIISISNFEDVSNLKPDSKRINTEVKNCEEENKNNKEKKIISNKKEKEKLINTRINNNSCNNIFKTKKDKSEIENIQKIISSTVKSLNINLSNKKKNNEEISHEIQKDDKLNNPINNAIKVNQNQNIYAPKKIISQIPNIQNNPNISEKKTYYKKILLPQKRNNFSSNEKVKNKKIRENFNKLNMSYEGMNLNKMKNLLNNSIDNNSFITQNQNSNNYFALNNCRYNLNNNTNNIFYEITSPSSDFLFRLNNDSVINNMNTYRFMNLNKTYLGENLVNINDESIHNEKINNINLSQNYEDIINLIDFEDLIILDNKLNEIKESLNSKKRVINESFEYLNYFYNSSIYHNSDILLGNIIDRNYIKIFLVCKLLTIIICYDCSIENKIFEQTYLLLKELVDLNYKNTILLYEYILENIKSLNRIKDQNVIYTQKIKQIINRYKNSNNKNELNEFLQFSDKIDNIPFPQKLKTNTNFIINNINLILSNIKSKNNDYIKTLYKSINNISFRDIFHYYFTYILYITNFQSSILGQTITGNNLLIRNNNIIPYIKTKNIKKYSLVLDLEETLLHFNKDGNNNNEGYVDIRPGTLKFLDDLSEYYELIVFNEGEKKFTDLLIDSLEQNKIYFEHRFYREHTIIDNNDIVKDLIRIGRALDKILIIDNMKQNFKFQKDNGIVIKSFFGEENYNILYELEKILIKIAQDGGDIRKGIIKYKNEIINKVTLGNNYII